VGNDSGPSLDVTGAWVYPNSKFKFVESDGRYVPSRAHASETMGHFQMDTINRPRTAPSRSGEETTELWFLDHAPILGGAERFALKLALASTARTPPIRSVVVCPDESELAARSRAAGIEVRPADFPEVSPPSPHAPAAIFALHRLLSGARQSTIFIANTARAQAYVAAALAFSRRKRRVVNLAHEQETAARGIARAALRRCGVVVAIGANAAAAYQRALPGIRVQKINNVLDDGELASAVSARARLLRLAVLARMIPEKGIIELIDEAAASSQHWSTLTIGAPPQDRDYEARVTARIAELGMTDRLRLLGAVLDVAGFLDAADVLVVPSTGCEGQPTTIIEALARGLSVLVREPILSADFGGMPVSAYHDAGDFGAALAALRPPPVPVDDMRRHFGADQAVDGLIAAAGLGQLHETPWPGWEPGHERLSIASPRAPSTPNVAPGVAGSRDTIAPVKQSA
jgi:glycosyltransferase involved in cell wall biosynthesis